MHLQISGSPGDTASNMRTVTAVLAAAHVNILGIGPDFTPPHVRVAVNQIDPYNPNDRSDFNVALDAMHRANLAPSIKAAVTVTLPNKPGALQVVLNRLSGEGYAAESVLVLAGGSDVQVGVAAPIPGWDVESGRVKKLIEDDLRNLP
jgi:hypothetical protein